MRNFLGKKRNKHTIYLPGRSFHEEPIISETPLLVVEEFFTPQTEEELRVWREERKQWEKQNDPNYYVHPKYWYKRTPGLCGQGYSILIDEYYERLDERREERLAKLKTKFPFIALGVISGSVVGATLLRIFRIFR